MSSASLTGHIELDKAIQDLYLSLYTQFEHEIIFEPLDQLMTLLHRLDIIGKHMLGALIDIHAKKKEIVEETPFGGRKESQNSAKFDVRQFDPILQHILFEFSKRHLSKLHGIQPS
jgi:hypothetical protein